MNFDLATKLSNRNIILISTGIAFLGVLLAILSGFGFDKIITEVDKDYDKALKFTEDNASEFPYAVKTKAGNLNASGEIKAASELVKNEHLPNEYLAIMEIMQEYREHTYTYSCNCTTVNNRTTCQTCTDSYWSWDYAGSKTTKVEKISLLGQEMTADFIPWDVGYITEVMSDGHMYLDTAYHKRSLFQVIHPGKTGTFGFTSNDNGFVYNPSLNVPKSSSWNIGKVIVQILFILSGIAAGIAFLKYNYEYIDHYI